jgi:Na+/H+ antiporter NhaD/arsenite permease-like protein
MTFRRAAAAGLLTFAAVEPAAAAPALDGAHMGWPWMLPFAGLLVTIATGPLLFPRIWHRHYGKIAAAWAASALLAIALDAGAGAAVASLAHAALAEYASFIALLFALYVVAGGILVTGDIAPTPRANLAFLAFGAGIASIVGTTGAAMILIRPLLAANAARRHNVHVVIFFIILVGNIGGALTPLGDPPLFVGFLRGVDFFWTARHLWPQTLIAVSLLLAIFFALDCWFARRESPQVVAARTGATRLRVRGGINLLLVAAIIANILLAALWRPGIAFNVLGTEVALQNAVRDIGMLATALASLWLTPGEHRAGNGFTFEPIREVAILFAAIFTTIIPVLAMLHAGRAGLFAPLLQVITEANGNPHEVAYFWLTGSLSAFLDNAPTYLVFFELAGGDAAALMGPLAGTLAGISLGAVFMGALTYIGNAPNFMIYAIATERGVKMPSFFGYMLCAAVLLLPIFVLLTLLPIAPTLPP